MDMHVSWRAVLHRIDESGTAEDRSILIAVGEKSPGLLPGNLELGLYTNLLGNSRSLLLGSTKLVDLMLGRID